ncbi:protein dispatched homolog 1-like [Amphibalanus amphitrite]|uniref:protein dispatched homolog 1-like n=1 Tax=Amphibalanus amphitrite TaxID=1232801 RepID=UPI001C8FDFAA|nr:protein dispatched homolog 1-like [Amphibalanus amphitrite]
MNWYVRLLASHPYLVILAVAAATGACITVVFTSRPLPDFADPMLGFETRGTELSQRLSAWNNLQKAAQAGGPLTNNPSMEPDSPHFWMGPAAAPVAQPSASPPPQAQVLLAPKPGGAEAARAAAEEEEWRDLSQLGLTGRLPPAEPSGDDRSEQGRRQEPQSGRPAGRQPRRGPLSGTGSTWFCGPLVQEYGHAVFAPAPGAAASADSGPGSGLFQLDSIRSMCAVEERHFHTEAFPDFCQIDDATQRCCRSWSLGNYIALLYNRSDCLAIKASDVSGTLSLLRDCAPFYHGGQLQPDCSGRPCRDVPERCARHDAVYHLLHYILDSQFLPPQDPNRAHLSYAMTYLPLARSGAVLPYYRTLNTSLADNSTAVVAMDLGLKAALFDESLREDAVYAGAAAGCIVLLIWVYTGSLLVTLATLAAVAISLCTAYFVYAVVLELSFFPFMNLLAAIIAIGVGADDTFIFCKVWDRCKSDKNAGTLAKLVGDSLRQAALSMLVTSLTTAAAFFSSCVSHVTAIACFSIFSGMTILINLVLMVTWTPGFVVMRERFCQWCPPLPLGAGGPLSAGRPCPPRRRCGELGRVLFDKLLPCVVVKLRWLWLVVLAALAVAAALVVCYQPRLRLPESQQFALFRSSHLFERYDALLAQWFWFERGSQAQLERRLPLRFVWGVLPLDGGDRLNPADRGTLRLDRRFQMESAESQRWLLQFCRELRQQGFYQSTQGPLLSNCFIETFKDWMEGRQCVDEITGEDREPCCRSALFPYPEAVFTECLVRAVRSLHNTPAQFFEAGPAGPKFLKSTGRVAAVVVEYDSNYTFSLAHDEMHEFVTAVETWTVEQMRSAPPEMAGGWFISFTDFYDLQTALADGTLLAIGVAVGLAFLVLMLTTLDLRVSLFAAVTVACVIFVTVAALVLLGWRLNVLEAVAVTVAIGLSVDFTLHYSVAYRAGEQPDREARVVHALSSVGSPIAMAALTTLLAGVCMLPSQVLAYLQIGVFLIVLTAVSWTYATLFFLPLLRVWGPERACGPCQGGAVAFCERSAPRADKAVYNYTVSESTLSTSSNAFLHPAAGETYELEPLTPGQRRRPWRVSQPDLRQRSASVGDAAAPGPPAAATPGARKKSLPSLTLEGGARRWAAAGSATTVVLCEDTGDVEPNRCPGVPDVWVRRT